MNSIQVADQTFIAADPADIGRAISKPRGLAPLVA